MQKHTVVTSNCGTLTVHVQVIKKKLIQFYTINLDRRKLPEIDKIKVKLDYPTVKLKHRLVYTKKGVWNVFDTRGVGRAINRNCRPQGKMDACCPPNKNDCSSFLLS